MNESSTRHLKALMNEYRSNRLLFDGFKRRAMEYVHADADVTVKDDYEGKTLFHYLVLSNKQRRNDAELIELLQLDRSLVNAFAGSKNTTPLIALMNQLVSGGCSIHDFKNTAMLLAVEGADLVVQDDHDGNTLMHHLVLRNQNGDHDSEISQLLTMHPKLANVFNNQKDGRHIRPLAVLMEQYHASKTGDMTQFKSTAMMLAIPEADLFVTDYANGNTLLHLLVSNNIDGINKHEIERLLKLDRSLIHARNNAGNTPLHHLIQLSSNVSIEEVEELLSIGSDIRTENNNKETLLHTVSATGNVIVGRYLVERGLDIQAKTTSNQTMLHCATVHRHRDVWMWLLESGVDMNAQDDRGQTALHLAVQKNNVEMAIWLIEHGADVNIEDHNRNTPLSIATVSNHKIAERLINAGALVENGDEPLVKTSHTELLHAILEMHNYGEYLRDEKKSKKGQVAIDLAGKLCDKVFAAFMLGTKPANFPKFRREVLELLNSKNDEMAEYRPAWKTILANIAIALTGIGAIAIAGKLIHSKVTQGRALFFFQAAKTTREKHVDDIRVKATTLCA